MSERSAMAEAERIRDVFLYAGKGPGKQPLKYLVRGWHVHSDRNRFWIARYDNGTRSEYLVTVNGKTRQFLTYDNAKRTADRLNKRDYPDAEEY
jgi:hypothetical protein